LRVFTQDANGQDVELFYGGNYSAVINGSGLVTITLTTGNLTNGYKLSLQRGIPYTQTVTPGAAYNAATIATALDRLSMEIVRLKGDVDRCIKIPYLEAGGDAVVKIPDNSATRANGALIFSNGNIAVGVASPGSATITAWAQTLLNDSNAAEARVTLGGVNTVDTIAEMTALVADNRTGTVLVQGYFSPDDGGGGRFYWDAASSASDNGGTVISSDAGGTGRFIRVIEGNEVNVKQFGAVGDEVVDDTAALQAAIDYCAGVDDFGDTSLLIPDGNYRFDYLRLPGRIKIRGNSMHSTVLKRIDSATNTTAIQEKSSAVKIQIFDLTLAGNNQAGNGLDLGNVTGNPSAFSVNAKLDNLLLRDFGGQNLRIYGNVAVGGFISSLNAGTGPAIQLDGSAGSFERIEVFQSSPAISAIKIADARCVIGEIYIEGAVATPVVEFSASGSHVKHLHTNLGMNLGTVTDLLLFSAGSNKCVLDHVFSEYRSGTTLTNIIADASSAITLTAAVYDADNRPFSYSQSVGAINGLMVLTATTTLKSNVPYGVISATSSCAIVKLPPVASARFQTITVVNDRSAANVDIEVNPSDTGKLIDGIADAVSLPSRYDSYTLTSDGTQWLCVSRSLKIYSGSATYDPANLVDGAGVTTTVTVTGAALGDYALVSFSLDLQGVTVTSWVSSANTVSVRFQNESGGAMDLASGTLRARVKKL
jgi:hypothetical protein